MLGTPPAFILSQDQTLMFNLLVQNLLAFTNYFNPCPKSVSRILDFRAAPRVHMQACHSPRYSRILLFKVLFSEFLPDEMTFHLIYSESFRVALLFICQGTRKAVAFLFNLSFLLSAFHKKCNHRRRDLNPRAAINDLHPFQGCPFSLLGTSANYKKYAK